MPLDLIRILNSYYKSTYYSSVTSKINHHCISACRWTGRWRCGWVAIFLISLARMTIWSICPCISCTVICLLVLVGLVCTGFMGLRGIVVESWRWFPDRWILRGVYLRHGSSWILNKLSCWHQDASLCIFWLQVDEVELHWYPFIIVFCLAWGRLVYL